MPDPYAQIHHFDHTSVCYDEDGDVMIGYYYEILDGEGYPLCGLMGPYGNKDEVEAACAKEWKRL